MRQNNIHIKQKIIDFIKVIQKYFKIDLIYIIKGEFWLMTGKIISVIISFFLFLAWANLVDPEIYGNYQYIISIFGIISIASLPGLGTAIIPAIARKAEGMLTKSFFVQLKWGLIGSLISLFLSGYYWFNGNRTLFLSFLVIAFFLPLFQASQIYISYLQGKKLFNIQIKYTAIVQLIGALFVIATLFLINRFFANWPFYLIVGFLILAYFLPKTFLHFSFWLRTRKKFQTNQDTDSQSITFGKHLTLANCIDIAASSLDRILLFHYLGAVQVAIYSFAFLIPDQINSINKHLSALALPKFATRTKEEIKKMLMKKVFYLSLLMSIAALFYILLAPYIYQIFLPQYIDSVPFSRIIAISIIPLSFSIIGEFFRSKMMIKQIYLLKIISPIIRIILFIILIPLYGIWGAAFGLLIIRFVHAVFIVGVYQKS